MQKLLLSTVLASCFAVSAQAEVVVLSWGGAYGAAEVEAHVKPFIEATGIKTTMIDADNPAAPVKAQTESGNVSVDVALLEYADAVRLCDEGLLEEIDPAILLPGDDGTPAEEDFLPGAVMDCGISTDLWANVVAYDDSKFPGEKPTSIADFFDLEKFPGTRGVKKSPKTVLEMALMADGVPAAEVYDVLDTDEGLDRAFAKLDTIKDHAIWWEAGAQPPQLLADGEVVMTTAYNGRIFNAAIEEGKPLVVLWDGQVYEHEMYVIPKGAPHLEDALKYVQFATSTEGLRRQAQYISYGPTRYSSNAGEIIFKDGKTVMGPHLPTYPANMENALETNLDFWVDNDSELNERFNAWLAN
ncbi:putative spermidine/putrescine transport system substrate-binding protein [Rhodobacter aestuarii]|uniref:Putative spermidine/putrescine transport system substrate-binding protein n=1 Tax=Rhodobacter aestuarii TaxID=453582 RepID=A0A1N7K3R5_9RHOB|nr:ABC transporter substrate-binding protein [Rhodobacter aestuarii]PTV95870.1 putative spermidine/putrescine transport system substrate-binding protein [Rhodobacter aestuarii]SIS56209.1 putative spermidine/putrescine transport system substrate-binding protein [Rhodobacter aestuarii]